MAWLDEMQAMVTVWAGILSENPAPNAAWNHDQEWRTRWERARGLRGPAGRRPYLSGDVAGLDLLDDCSIDDVVDSISGQVRPVQQAPGETPTEPFKTLKFNNLVLRQIKRTAGRILPGRGALGRRICTPQKSAWASDATVCESNCFKCCILKRWRSRGSWHQEGGSDPFNQDYVLHSRTSQSLFTFCLNW